MNINSDLQSILFIDIEPLGSDNENKKIRELVIHINDFDLLDVSYFPDLLININGGIGTKALNILIDYTDKAKKRIDLTPSADFGGNKNKLIKYYKRFGFVENKGRNKDYEVSETMNRNPNK